MRITYYVLRIADYKTVVALAAIVLIGWMGFIIFKSPLRDSKEVVIKEGQGVYAIADILKEDGVIENKFVFIVYTLITGNEKKLQAGRYIFRPRTTVPIVVYSMAKGLAESDDTIITVPEGFNVFDIDKRLNSSGLTGDSDFVKKYYGDEGYFFPDTYRLHNLQFTIYNLQTKNLNEQNQSQDGLVTELANKMLANFKSKTTEAFGSLSVQKQRETIIIASMLEKEAKTKNDMRLIAGIIKNRLEQGILLQIDAAVAYGACLKLSGLSPDNLRNSKFETLNPKQIQSSNTQVYKYCDVSQVRVADEIKIDGPYNTYIRAGLPPGPISNPGLKAIQAALKQADTDFLYYLSTRDGSQTIFSKTAAEHAANRRRYLGL